MMSYKDQTFCKSDCTNTDCYRYFGEYHRDAARKWWSHDPDNAPIAWADFSVSCEEYMRQVDHC